MIGTEKQLLTVVGRAMLNNTDRLVQIMNRQMFEESKLQLAQNYRDDVAFLLELLANKEQQLEELRQIDRTSPTRAREFLDELAALCHKHQLEYCHSMPCASEQQ